MTIATAKRMSLEEYLTHDSDTRNELVNGVLVVMSSESRCNIKIALFLIQTFLQLVDYDRLGIKEKIVTHSTHATARDPDLIIHSKASSHAIENKKESCLALSDPNPLIVIEIVSPGTESTDNYQRDYIQKPTEYANRAIPEMWQIDPERQWVKIGNLINGAYEFTTFTAQDTIVSPTFPTLTLTAAQILNAGRP